MLFIGLNGAETELLLPWMREGHLPHLRALHARGAWGRPETPQGFADQCFWQTFVTGVNPGRHGCYLPLQMVPRGYSEVSFHEQRDLRHEPFWLPLSRVGRSVAIVDMVRSPLTAGIGGVQVVEWLTHDATGPFRTWPETLVDDIAGRYGRDPFRGTTDGLGRTEDECVRLRDGLIARIRTKVAFCREQLRERRFDLRAITFHEAHDVGHQCWHVHDPSHPAHDAAVRNRLGDPVKDVYVALDAAIGELVEASEDGSDVFVLAGLGMGPHFTGNPALERLLRRWEGLPDRYEKPPSPRGRQAAVALDRAHRRAFAIPPTLNSGAVRLNVVGREPVGRVRPGTEYDAVCDEIEEVLRAVVNEETGGPLVREVVRVRRTCHGAALDALPDLLVVWDRTAEIRCVRSPRLGCIDVVFRGGRTGDHTPRALFLAAGDGIAAGELEAFSTVDVAPSMAGRLGVALDSDGRPLARLRPRTPATPAA